MYGINYLLIGCMLVVLQNRRISLKGGLTVAGNLVKS